MGVLETAGGVLEIWRFTGVDTCTEDCVALPTLGFAGNAEAGRAGMADA